jgi:hypothetical protein
VVDGVSDALMRLPVPDPADHAITLRTRLWPEGGSWAAQLEGRARGYPDYALRAAARAAAGEIATRPVFAELLRPAAAPFGLREQTHTPPLQLREDFTWRAEGTVPGLGSALPDGGQVLRAPFWLPRDWDGALHSRRSGLFLHDGYPLRVEQTVHVQLPDGARDVGLPAPATLESGPLHFRCAWSRGDAGTVEARLEIEAPSGELPPDEARPFQEGLRRLLAVAAQGVTYRGTPGATR